MKCQMLRCDPYCCDPYYCDPYGNGGTSKAYYRHFEFRQRSNYNRKTHEEIESRHRPTP